MKKQINLKSRSNRQAVLKPLFNQLKIKDLITVYSRWEKIHKTKRAYQKAKELSYITFNSSDTIKAKFVQTS